MTGGDAATRSRAAGYFQRCLLVWAESNRRDFPWRNKTDSYSVIIAEMMLRRTQARQVVPVYNRFLQLYPDVRALAHSTDGQVASVVRPLGLSWRAPSFRAMAKAIIASHEGRFPNDRKALMSLPGVGEYVADAVRCLVLDQPGPIVDTNTVRVAARYLGFKYNAESRRRTSVRSAVSQLIGERHPRVANLAILDFAALVCTAKSPKCNVCPVRRRCTYFAQR